MSRRRRIFRFSLKRESLISITAIFCLLLGVLTFISFFAQAASGSSFLQDSLNKLFGWGAFLVPFILVSFGLILLRQNFGFLKFNTFLGLCLMLFAFTSLSHLIFFRKNGLEAAAVGQGGGLLGFQVSSLLSQSFTPWGSFFILLALLFVSFLVILNTSLNKFLFFFLEGGRRPFHFIRGLSGRRPVPKAARTEVVQEELQLPATKLEPKINPSDLKSTSPTKPELDKLRVEVLPISIDWGRGAKGKAAESPGESKSLPKSNLVYETVKNVPRESYVWEYPPLSLLSEAKVSEANRGDVANNAAVIERSLDSFGIKARVVEVNLGPAVTQYALELAQGTKIVRVKSLQNDLALALASSTGTVRVEAPIPGKSLIGIEIPNLSPATVTLKTILSSDLLAKGKSKLLVALGLDVSGRPVIADIARMPHVLIAGSTGSGKSTLIHAMMTTLLFRCSPEELKFILVDTKRVELTEYNDLPHLLTPVITDPERVLAALKWSISEMERRYKLFQSAKVRNIDAYNELSGFQALPYILILVDEMADLMQMAPVEVEKSVCRLAQMARATGLHLILATQRPSVDILTGLIKANIPTRIAFNVTSQIDSRVIIDQAGAEKLLGRGDMLYLPPESSKPVRIQGVYVSPVELRALTDFLRGSPIKPEYQAEVVTLKDQNGEALFEGSEDELFAAAVEAICQYDRASASLLQRRLKIGYARAARLLDEMEAKGIVGPAEGSKPREVLIHDSSQILGEGHAGGEVTENDEPSERY